jgi:hypothetical protein
MTAKSTDSEFSAVVVSPHVQFGFESLGPLPEPKNPPVIGEAGSRWVLEDDSAIGLRPIPPALVDGMIGAQSLAVVTGEPKVGKSFLAVHLMMSVAVGSPFFGRRVTRGPVVYVAAEGIIHMPKRIDAWKLAHNATGRAGVHFLSGSVRFTEEADAANFLALLKTMPEAPVLVIVDTLARAMAGSEESLGKDMGIVIRAAERIQRDIGAAVLFIHHPAKGEKTAPRGSTQLIGAADMFASVTAKGALRVLRCDGIKDYPEFEDMAFSLMPVGDSLVVVPVRADSESDTQRSAATLTDREREVLTTLPNAPGVETQSNEWKDACVQQKIPISTFNNVVGKLVASEYVTKHVSGQNVFYSMTDAGRTAIGVKSNEPVL